MAPEDPILREIFTGIELQLAKDVKLITMEIGQRIEKYIDSSPMVIVADSHKDVNWDSGFYSVYQFQNMKGSEYEEYRHCDYIIDGQKWQVKSRWNSANSAHMQTFKDYNIKHWWRLNKDMTTNWNKPPFNVLGLDDRSFTEYFIQKVFQ